MKGPQTARGLDSLLESVLSGEATKGSRGPLTLNSQLL
jgi:hypothetical protein